MLCRVFYLKFMGEGVGMCEKELFELGINRVHIDYYGIRFVCEPYDVDNCINWLLINRPVPEHVKRKCGIYVDRVRYEFA